MLYTKPNISSKLLDDLNRHRAAFELGEWCKGAWGGTFEDKPIHCIVGRMARTDTIKGGGFSVSQALPDMIAALWEQLPAFHKWRTDDKRKSITTTTNQQPSQTCSPSTTQQSQ
jgi:hypothetical protein